MAEFSKIPVIGIVGPTASGKTALSVKLAQALDGEIVSCDSMQIYRQMSVGTAKPSLEEREGVVHHLMDFLDVSEPFSVADYCKRADEVIRDIHVRGKRVLVVGGTGLYFSSLIDHITFEDQKSDSALRERLQRDADEYGGEYLLRQLEAFDPETAKSLHPNNVGRIIRAIEVYRTTGQTMSQKQRLSRACESPYLPCLIGLTFRDRAKLYDRIDRRVDLMMEQGLLEENRRLLTLPLSDTASQAIGFKEFLPYLYGQAPLEECVENLKRQSRRYAKRQLTWFRRDARIFWIHADEHPSFDSILRTAYDRIENRKEMGD